MGLLVYMPSVCMPERHRNVFDYVQDSPFHMWVCTNITEHFCYGQAIAGAIVGNHLQRPTIYSMREQLVLALV